MKNAWRFTISIALGCALLLASASSAAAALITLGPPLATTTFENEEECYFSGACTEVQVALPGPSLVASPVDGTVVGWAIEGASPKPGYALRVAAVSEGTFTPLETSASQTPVGAGIETFATSLPIKKGQHLGLVVPPAGVIDQAYPASAKLDYREPSPADGETVNVTEQTGELALSAQVQPAPAISALSPGSGPPAGGTQVTITGTDLEGASAVRFGSAPAIAFAVNSESQITAFAPPGTGAVPVTVTTVAGTATAPQPFTYATPATTPSGSSPPPSPAPICTVPKLKDKTLKGAKKRIRAAGCAVGKPTKKEGATAKDGEVVKQAPKPGATVPAGTRVKVTLAPS